VGRIRTEFGIFALTSVPHDTKNNLQVNLHGDVVKSLRGREGGGRRIQATKSSGKKNETEQGLKEKKATPCIPSQASRTLRIAWSQDWKLPWQRDSTLVEG
jgi:hypothetical protein